MVMNRKKIIIILAAVIIGVVLVNMLYSYLTSQQLTITTNDDKAVISLQSAGGTERRVGTGKSVSLRLALGDYALKATSGNKETRGFTSLKRGKAATVDMKLETVRLPQLIDTKVMRKPLATNDSIRYLNPAFGQLEAYSFTSKSTVVLRPDLYQIADVFWLTPSSGYFQDEEGTFNYFDSTAVTPLDQPTGSIIAVSPDGSVAAVTSTRVSVLPGPGAAEQYGFGLKMSEPAAAYGAADHLLVYDQGSNPEGKTGISQPALYIGGKKSDLTSKIKDLFISGAVWSPDGGTLALATGTGAYVLHISSGELTRLSASDSAHANSFAWLNAESLLYFNEQTIWQINLPKHTWTKLAAITQSVPPDAPFAISPDGKSLFFTTDTIDGGGLVGGLYSFSLAPSQ